MRARALVVAGCVALLGAGCGSSSKSEPAQAVASCEDAARSAQQAAPSTGSAASSAPSVVADERSDQLRVFTIRGVAGGRSYTCTNTRAPSDGKFRPLVDFDS